MDIKKTRGRPSVQYNEKELYAIVQHYRENVLPQGDIKYLNLYKYHLELHKERPDICSRTFSEDFWRKKGQAGRGIIDTVNEIRTVSLTDSNNKKKEIPNVVDVVSKYIKTPDKLLDHLIPLENEVKRSIEKERKLQEKNEDLKAQLKEMQAENRNLRERLELFKKSMFKQFHYSAPDGVPLENLLDINNKNKRIKRALEEAWLDPQGFYLEFEKYTKEENEKQSDKNKNVVSFKEKKSEVNKTIADDFKGRF